MRSKLSAQSLREAFSAVPYLIHHNYRCCIEFTNESATPGEYELLLRDNKVGYFSRGSKFDIWHTVIIPEIDDIAERYIVFVGVM